MDKVSLDRQILAWRIGDRVLGMDIRDCREVDRNKDIVQVPHSKAQIAGIVNLRGDIVTVIDMRILLGHEVKETKTENVIIRLKNRGHNLALKADSVYDVVAISSDQIESAPAHMTEVEQRYIDFVASTSRGLIVVLNPDEILRAV